MSSSLRFARQPPHPKREQAAERPPIRSARRNTYTRRLTRHLSRLPDHKFAESVSLSSTALVDFRLAATVLELGFDLLGLRARRKEESRGWPGPFQGCPETS